MEIESVLLFANNTEILVLLDLKKENQFSEQTKIRRVYDFSFNSVEFFERSGALRNFRDEAEEVILIFNGTAHAEPANALANRVRTVGRI